MKKYCILSLIVILLAGISLAGYAGTFPEKQITIIVQASPGGTSDTKCRTMAAAIEPLLGVPIVVINKTGAAGAVAFSYVASQKPDGYTIGNLSIELTMLKALGYADVMPENFDLLCMPGAYNPSTITVNANSPWNTAEEFLAYAKENPGVITVGNSGIGSIWHIAALKLEKALGIEFTHVPFTGASMMKVALMGGHIACSTGSPMENASGVLSGDLRMLAVMADKRFSKFPDVPTLKELGYDVQTTAWSGLGCPKGLPAETKKILVDALKKGYESEIYQNMQKTRGYEPGFLGPEEFTEFAQAEYKTYSKLLPELGMGKK